MCNIKKLADKLKWLNMPLKSHKTRKISKNTLLKSVE